ncbi:MAG: hypothetical protein R3C60_08640 [Parvularculaceae bacterium]
MQAAAVAVRDEAASDDYGWVKANLRMKDGEPIVDLANCIRVFERHADFKGRFKFNEVLNKVLDKGTVMLDWRVSDTTATVQERFIPEVTTDMVLKALVVVANRAGS